MAIFSEPKLGVRQCPGCFALIFYSTFTDSLSQKDLGLNLYSSSWIDWVFRRLHLSRPLFSFLKWAYAPLQLPYRLVTRIQ